MCLEAAELEWLRGLWGRCWKMRPNSQEEGNHEDLTDRLGFRGVGNVDVLRGRTGIAVMV